MDDEKKEKLKKQIKEEIGRLEQIILSLEEGTKPVEPDRAIGRLTRMDAIHTKNIQEANLNSARENKYQLEQVLERIDVSFFCKCVRCKEDIPLERIMAVPQATKCVKCLT